MHSRQLVDGERSPKILVVGTHRDLEHTCTETRVDKNATLLNMFQSHKEDLAYYKVSERDELIFPVNAKNPTEEDQKVAEQFRKVVSKCSETVEVPIPWFVFDHYLRQRSDALHRKILRTSECDDEAKKLHMKPEACEAALKYLDKINMVFYRPEYLKGLVFTGVQVLLDKISELIECIYKLHGMSAFSLDLGVTPTPKDGTDSAAPLSSTAMPDRSSTDVLPDLAEFYHHEGIRFRDYAIVTINILQKFPSHYVDGLFTPTEFLKLLTAFLVTAPVSEGSTEYIMPCLLQEIPSKELDKHRQLSQSSPACPLMIRFPDDCVPAGIFVVLITYLHTMAGWRLRLTSNKPHCLRRNCVTFLLPSGGGGFVTLIDSFKYLEVHIHNSSETACRKACSRIHDNLFEGVKVAATQLRYGHLSPQPAFLCPTPSPDCQCDHHVADMVENELVCSVSGITTGEFSDRHNVWLSTKNKDDPPCDRALTTDDHRIVYNAVYGTRIKWSVLGTELGLSRTEVVNIADENRGTSDCNAKCLAVVLTKWLERRHSLAPSWRSLVRALKSETVGEEGVACDIERK